MAKKPCGLYNARPAILAVICNSRYLWPNRCLCWLMRRALHAVSPCTRQDAHNLRRTSGLQPSWIYLLYRMIDSIIHEMKLPFRYYRSVYVRGVHPLSVKTPLWPIYSTEFPPWRWNSSRLSQIVLKLRPPLPPSLWTPLLYVIECLRHGHDAVWCALLCAEEIDDESDLPIGSVVLGRALSGLHVVQGCSQQRRQKIRLSTFCSLVLTLFVLYPQWYYCLTWLAVAALWEPSLSSPLPLVAETNIQDLRLQQ